MVQPTIGPADPRGDAAASHQWANPATSPTDRLLPRAVCRDNRSPGPICLQQPCSPGGRPKGSSLESGKSSTGGRLTEAGPWWMDPRASVWKIHLRLAGLSGRSSSNQPDSSDNRRPQYADTFEDSDDSTESFDGPFPGPHLSAVASSTTGTTPQMSK